MGLFSFFSPKVPPKDIIKLERLNEGQALRVLLWADVPVQYQKFYADPNATSAFLDATDTELKGLRSGVVAERVVTLNTVGAASVDEERETLNDAHPDYKKVLDGEKVVPDYVMATVAVKTLVQWDEATLDQALGDAWQAFQNEVNAGLKGGSDFSNYGEANEIAP